MEQLHFFKTNSEFETQYSTNYIEPWVSYTEDENRVDYNRITREMLIFQYIYCNNVTEEDKERLKNVNIHISVETGNNPLVIIEFSNANKVVSQAVNISQELATQLSAIFTQYTDESQDQLLDMVLPMFKCVGNPNHNWVYNGVQ